MFQSQRFRKTAADAELRYLITDVWLEAVDGNGPTITLDQCPGWVPNDVPRCNRAMDGWVMLAIVAKRQRGFSCHLSDSRILDRGASLDLSGWSGKWEFATGGFGAGTSVWTTAAYGRGTDAA